MTLGKYADETEGSGKGLPGRLKANQKRADLRKLKGAIVCSRSRENTPVGC